MGTTNGKPDTNTRHHRTGKKSYHNYKKPNIDDIEVMWPEPRPLPTPSTAPTVTSNEPPHSDDSKDDDDGYLTPIEDVDSSYDEATSTQAPNVTQISSEQIRSVPPRPLPPPLPPTARPPAVAGLAADATLPTQTRPTVAPKPVAGVRPSVPATSSTIGYRETVRSPVQELHQAPWFFESTNRAESERTLLQIGRDGTFLVRPCRHAGPNKPYTLTLLYRSVVHHINIRMTSNGKYALGSEKTNETIFNSVCELISFYGNNPLQLCLKTGQNSIPSTDRVLLSGSPSKS